MHVNVGIGGDITVGISADTAAFAVQHLNGVAFADGQIARYRAAIAFFKGKAGTFPVDVEDISSAVFIGHGQRHAGADACAIVGVYGDVS